MMIMMTSQAAPVTPRVQLWIVWSLVNFLLCPGAVVSLRSTPEWDSSIGRVDANVSSSVVLQFVPANRTRVLTHLVIDRQSNVVYVGAVNRLFQLDGASLLPVYQVITGPRLDSPECHPSGCEDSVNKLPTDNYNKLIVVAPSVDAVVACGSVSQGACDKYRLGNLSLHLDYIPKSVAANDQKSSTYAFIGPERYNRWGGSDVLYVGTTFTSVGNYRNDVPAISTRNLNDLGYAQHSFSEHSLLRIDVKYRDHFLVKYVYGFNSSDYVYFLTVQKKSHLPGQEELGYVTRISRTCISDANYESYTEVTLICQGPDRDQYNLIQDAKVIPAGKDLAKSMGIDPGSPVLITVFVPSKGHSSNPQRKSAICTYSIYEIEQKFNENIHMCFNGSMQYRNLEYISGPILDGKCPKQGAIGNIHSFCEVGLKILGPSPIVGRVSLRLPDVLVSAVQGAVTSSHTVAFLGTDDGRIKKVLIASAVAAAVYDDVIVDEGHRILPDMFLTKDRSHLIVLSERKVLKVKVESCSTHQNCSSCLRARDPYCGWCSLEKRCTIQNQCQKASYSSPRWLSFGAGQQCIEFESITPDRLPSDQMTTVQLTIRTLPDLPLGAKYQCVWGSAPPLDAEVTSTGLRCSTAPVSFRTPIPESRDHVLVPLSVRSSETRKDFVSRNFAFFNCSRHTTCNSCAGSSWACNWCVYENVCTQNVSSCSEFVISGDNNPTRLVSHGTGFCPSFIEGSSTLLAANEAKSEVVLFAKNLPTPRSDQVGFQCIVKVEGSTMVVSASLAGPPRTDELEMFRENLLGHEQLHSIQKVVCESSLYRYENEIAEYDAIITLVWNRNHVIDWTKLTIYKCSILGSHRKHQDCSLCVTRPSKYQCAWCGGACKYLPNCLGNAQALMQTEKGNDVNSSTTARHCPMPRIDVIQPLAGPLEGGTVVTIEGSNLGLKKSDIIGRVFIGNVPCRLRDYHVSVRIVCVTEPVPRALWNKDPEDLLFPVTVTTLAGSTESTVKFAFNRVVVNDVWPKIGPISGGTLLSIEGSFLNIGSLVTAHLDHLPCAVNKSQSSSHRLVCITARSTPPKDSLGSVTIEESVFDPPIPVVRLLVTVDGAKRTLDRPFTYADDPSVSEVKPLRSPWSGGRVLTVHGRSLDAIQSPKITVLFGDFVVNSSACLVISGSLMECSSPAVNKDTISSLLRDKRNSVTPERMSQPFRASQKISRSPRQDVSDTFSLDIGFMMDNVAAVRNLRHNLRSTAGSSLVYVPNPNFQPFPYNVKLYKGDTLVIEGEDLNLASDESDVNVTIGTQRCNVTSLALTQLVCLPPSVQPPATDEGGKPTGEDSPLVVVRVGRNLRFPIGFIRYELTKEYQFLPETVGGMAAGGAFLIIVSLAILVVYRRKSDQAEREYKRIQIQMDTLESNVRSECKQAFAELQTDMSDWNADLESSGIPTLDHRTYITKVFFPGVSDPPFLLKDPKSVLNGLRPSTENALVQFEQLLGNRFFLLTVIETLESQKTFNIRDKSNVASLLVVSLCHRMEYLTEILRVLLLRLMEKNVLTKHPQLMLRRAESVIEKMLTNWMAMCMYSYLKEVAGPSLFLLFKAIKYQVEKGPVDDVTFEARYSLSEERLLREQIDYSVVILTVICDNDEKMTCRVLECDTVSQVKMKVMEALYRNTPFSLRPSIHQVDLEWRHGRNGQLILSDEDMTTKVDGNGGWRRLNTLAHYGISSSAVVSLVPRVYNPYTLSNSTKHDSKTTNRRLGLNHRVDSTSPLTFKNDQIEVDSPRVYHLVRPVDHDSPCKGSERSHKAIPEIFLTRLLSTKGTIQKFVDDFFRTILNSNEGVPAAVKWLFDFFDDSAKRFGILDPEVTLSWKSNSLPLRFWVNFIKNPDFILDVHKPPTVDSCLSVIAQTFMDACSTSEHRLGKDSPSSKLLFAKDMSRYRAMVKGFYQGVRDVPPITDQDMAAQLHQLSLRHMGEVDTMAALNELFHTYIVRYYPQVMDSLESHPECRAMHLAHKLDNVICTLNGEPTSMC